MKTIQMTIDNELLIEVDDTISALKMTRSAFIRKALRLAIDRYKIRKLEERHEHGYKTNPVEPGEFDAWLGEQEWGDA